MGECPAPALGTPAFLPSPPPPPTRGPVRPADLPGARTWGRGRGRPRGSCDEPGPWGAEAVGGRGLPSPDGRRPSSVSCYSPRGRLPGPQRRGKRKRGRRQQRRPRGTQPPGSPPARHHTSARAAFVRSRHFRVPGGGAGLAPPRHRFAPPRGLLTSPDLCVPDSEEPQGWPSPAPQSLWRV